MNLNPAFQILPLSDRIILGQEEGVENIEENYILSMKFIFFVELFVNNIFFILIFFLDLIKKFQIYKIK